MLVEANAEKIHRTDEEKLYVLHALSGTGSPLIEV
jgi:ribosomal protein L22